MILSSEDKIREYTARGWWGETTLDDLLRRAVAANPGRLAVADAPNRQSITDGVPLRLDYAQVDARVDGIAASLLAHGIGRDDIVVVQMPNIVETMLLMLACGRIGAVISPVAVQYREHELRQIAATLAPKAFITVGRCGEARLAELATGFLQSSGSDIRLLVAGDDLLFEPANEAQRACVADYLSEKRPGANDVFSICWTSGTESRPKGVPRSHNHWIAIGKVVSAAPNLRDGDVLMGLFPMINMASIGGVLVPSLLCAGTMVLHHPFDLEVALGQIQAEGVNYSVLPPPVLNMLLGCKELLAKFDISSLRAVCSGSAPLASWMVEGWQREYGIGIINFFGSNEGVALASSVADVPDPIERAAYFPRYGVAGFTWAAGEAISFESRLCDPDTGEIITTPGREGELCIIGGTVFDGYFREPEMTEKSFDKEGYFHTGDLFVIAGAESDARYYQFVARHKELVIRGGQNISPAEMDNLVAGHPAVAEAACIGLPDEVMGERLCAVVVLRPGADLTLAELTAYLKAQHVAVYKWPEKLACVAELPRNPVGKVVRRDLRRLVHEFQ